MGSPLISDDEFMRRYHELGGNAYQLAKQLGQIHSSVAARAKRLKAKGPKVTEKTKPTLPDFPDDDIPVDQIIDTMCNRFEARQAHHAARKWFPIQMPDADPFAVAWFGDPHLDSNGANWPLIREHCALLSQPRVYCVNAGDTLDNWPHSSKLTGLYAHSDTSVETAKKLARWFMCESGLQWLVWLYGNHDLWPGHISRDWMGEIGKGIVCADWGAQFVLETPAASFKVWAAHDFPGNSMYNSLHGPQRAAHMKEEAAIYVCGHTHNWAIHREESGSRGFTYELVRARGYKYLDDYAVKLGHFPQRHGATVLTVFQPRQGRHYSFEHPEDGILFLRALLKRKAA